MTYKETLEAEIKHLREELAYAQHERDEARALLHANFAASKTPSDEEFRARRAHIGHTDEKFTCQAELIRTTVKGGALVRVGDKELWIPFAWIQPESEVKEEGDCGEMVIPMYGAIDKGLV